MQVEDKPVDNSVNKFIGSAFSEVHVKIMQNSMSS
jgi:hypothetical protein